MANKGTLTVRILGDTKGFKGALDDVGGMLPGWAKKTGLAIGGAGLLAGGLFASQLMGALDREASVDKLAAKLGLDEAGAKRVAGVASKVYAGAWGESMGEVQQAIGGVAQNLADLGEVTDDELFSLTTMALDVAKAFDVDVNEAIRTAATLMRNGLAVDAENAFDIITAGFQSGADRSNDLLDSFNEYSEPLSSLGISGGRALAIINSGIDDGIWNADRLLDGIKEFSIRVLEDGPDVVKAFSDMGLEADGLQRAILEGGDAATEATNTIIRGLSDLTDPMERERAGIALFGTIWEDVGGDVLLNALDPILAKTIEVHGATTDMGNDLNDNVATRIEEFKRRAGEAFQSWASDSVLPAIESVLDAFEEGGLGGAIDRVVELWDESWPEIERWLVNDFGPAVIAIGGEIGGAIGRAMADALGNALKGGLERVLGAQASLVGNALGLGGIGGVGDIAGAGLDHLSGIGSGGGGSNAAAAPQVTINMPPGADGQDVVDSMVNWSRQNGPVPVPVSGVLP